MKSYSTEGFIIQMRQLREADRLIVLYTKDFGRVESVAKGASRLLSRKSGSLDLLNLGKFSFHKTKGLDILTEVALLDDFSDPYNGAGR